MTTRRQFLAGAAALVAAPSVLTFASGARAVYDPSRVLVTLDGVALRGPITGYMWTFDPLPASREHLARHGTPSEPGWNEPDPLTPWNPHWKRMAAQALGPR